MNTLQCTCTGIMTLKSSNVKRRFGYALNFFHHELNSSDVFFPVLQYYLHCVLLAVSVFKKLYIVHLLMTDLFCKQSPSRSLESRSQSRVVELLTTSLISSCSRIVWISLVVNVNITQYPMKSNFDVSEPLIDVIVNSTQVQALSVFQVGITGRWSEPLSSQTKK